MKKRISPIILACLLLLLEALPLCAALHIPNSDGNHMVLFCSCFDIRPLLDGNFAPFVVAVMSVAILILCVMYFVKPSKTMKKIIFFVACAAMLLSFCPIFYCMQCYSLPACAIAFILFVLTMVFVEQAK